MLWSSILLHSTFAMSVSVSIVNLYSAESWSIFTTLCVLSGNVKINLSLKLNAAERMPCLAVCHLHQTWMLTVRDYLHHRCLPDDYIDDTDDDIDSVYVVVWVFCHSVSVDAVLLKDWQDAWSEFHTSEREGRRIHVHFTKRRGHSWFSRDVSWGPQDEIKIRHCPSGLPSTQHNIRFVRFNS